jgi:hypothetical protein
MDLLLCYGETRVAIELKVWRTKDPRSEGLAQLDGYLDGLGLQTGWLVIFDQRKKRKPLAKRLRALRVRSPAGRLVTLVRA